MNKGSKIFIFITGAILIVLSFSVIYYFFVYSRLLKETSIDFSTVKLAEERYVNSKDDFSIRYPDGWRLAKYYMEYLHTNSKSNYSPETATTIIITQASIGEESDFIDSWKEKEKYPNFIGQFASDKTIMISFNGSSVQQNIEITKEIMMDKKINNYKKVYESYLLNLPNNQSLYRIIERDDGMTQKIITYPCKNSTINVRMVDTNNTNEESLLAAIANSIECK